MNQSQQIMEMLGEKAGDGFTRFLLKAPDKDKLADWAKSQGMEVLKKADYGVEVKTKKELLVKPLMSKLRKAFSGNVGVNAMDDEGNEL